MGDWTFFSNYGHVLVCLARNRDARLRDVAQQVGITERAVQKIVRDLQDSGYLQVSKKGRCNRYRINRRKSLRHPLQSQCTVGKLLALISREDVPAEAGQAALRDEEPSRSEGRAPASSPEPGPEPAATAPAPVESPAQAGEPASAPTTKSETDSEPARPAESEAKRSGKRKNKRAPADTREQGSLF